MYIKDPISEVVDAWLVLYRTTILKLYIEAVFAIAERIATHA